MRRSTAIGSEWRGIVSVHQERRESRWEGLVRWKTGVALLLGRACERVRESRWEGSVSHSDRSIPTVAIVALMGRDYEESLQGQLSVGRIVRTYSRAPAR